MNLSFKCCNRQHGKGLSEKREAPARDDQQSACETAGYKRFMFAFRLLQTVIVFENILAFFMAAYFIFGVSLWKQ